MRDMPRIVPRIVDADENTQLFTTAHLILTTPAILGSVDSFAVMPGLGEHNRVLAAIHSWQTSQVAQHLLVSGSYRGEMTQPQLTIERLKEAPFNLTKIEGLIAQGEAAHTRVQTDWIIDQVRDCMVTSVALFVSHWHMPRAYLTLLRSMLNAGLRIPIFPVPVGSSPGEIVPEYAETVLRMSAGEAQRIKKYQENRQIASFTELTDYLSWLWKQQVMPVSTVDQ